MYWKSDCALCECVDSKEVCTYDSCRLTESDCLAQDQVLVNQEGKCCYCAPQLINVTTTTMQVPTTKKPTSNWTTPPTSTDCYFNGVDYNKPAPENQWVDGCHMCKCVDGISTCSKFCPISACPEGHVLSTDSDDCCSCVLEEPDCVYNNVSHKHGSSWTDGPCVECSCDKMASVTCVDHRQHCDVACDFETHELKYSDDQCCPTCVKKESCEPVVKTQRLFTADGCVSENEEEVSVCSGSCSSSTTMLQYPPYIQSNCHCCQPSEVAQKEVTAVCGDGSKTTISVPVIKSCACSGCGDY